MAALEKCSDELTTDATKQAQELLADNWRIGGFGARRTQHQTETYLVELYFWKGHIGLVGSQTLRWQCPRNSIVDAFDGLFS